MSRAGGRSGLSEEARFELAVAAGAQEKRNRPVGLVVIGCVVLAVSLVLASVALATRNSALHDRRKALADEKAVEQMARDWQGLIAQERLAPGTGVGEKMPGLLSRMEQLAREAGVKTTPQNPQTKVDQKSGIVVTEYTYGNVKDDSLAALLGWIQRALEIPGMELTGLKLKADAKGWSLDEATFRRWERAG
jgi:hypothetical protein